MTKKSDNYAGAGTAGLRGEPFDQFYAGLGAATADLCGAKLATAYAGGSGERAARQTVAYWAEQGLAKLLDEACEQAFGDGFPPAAERGNWYVFEAATADSTRLVAANFWAGNPAQFWLASFDYNAEHDAVNVLLLVPVQRSAEQSLPFCAPYELTN